MIYFISIFGMLIIIFNVYYIIHSIQSIYKTEIYFFFRKILIYLKIMMFNLFDLIIIFKFMLLMLYRYIFTY